MFSAAMLVAFSGCVKTSMLVESETAQKSDDEFSTNLKRYKGAFKQVETRVERDSVIEELLTASDMQCNAFQYKADEEEETDGIYTSIFNIAGKYIGLDIAKDAIEAVSTIADMQQKKSNQDKYAQALKPNIIMAVQVSREKYLQKIKAKQQQGLKQYGIFEFEKDLEAYDKRCSTYYGLIEINKALKMSMQAPTKESQRIKVEEVKEKIKAVTKEIK